MINLIIADDHQIFIDGIKTVLVDEPDINVVGEALNGKQVLKLLKIKPVDIVLLDIEMPEMDGLETAEIIQKQYPDVKTIILTNYNNKGFFNKAQKYGCAGFIVKDTSKKELVNAIEVVSRGGTYYDPKIVKKTKFDNYKAIKLSTREKQILKYIINEKTNNEISKEMKISKNTVRTYKERLLNKTGNTTIAGLVKWAVKNNYI